MKFGKQASIDLEKVRKASQRKVRNAIALLTAGSAGPVPEDGLRQHVLSQLAAESPEERRAMQVRMAMALAEIQSANAELVRVMAEISEEVARVGRSRQAAQAYRRSANQVRAMKAAG